MFRPLSSPPYETIPPPVDPPPPSRSKLPPAVRREFIASFRAWQAHTWMVDKMKCVERISCLVKATTIETRYSQRFERALNVFINTIKSGTPCARAISSEFSSYRFGRSYMLRIATKKFREGKIGGLWYYRRSYDGAPLNIDANKFIKKIVAVC